jgi:hypothetical protein
MQVRRYKEEDSKIQERIEILEREHSRKISDLEGIHSILLAETAVRLSIEKRKGDSVFELLSKADTMNPDNLKVHCN